jgi:hypothetical protein
MDTLFQCIEFMGKMESKSHCSVGTTSSDILLSYQLTNLMSVVLGLVYMTIPSLLFINLWRSDC